MRLCTYIHGEGPRLGLVEDASVRPVEAPDLMAVVRGEPTGRPGPAVALAEVTLAAPLQPGKLIGIGLNYRDHAAETGAALPTEPLLFAKLASSVTGPAGEVVRPGYTDELDYEGELAVVIGRRVRDVPRERALSPVFGY